MSVGRKLLQVQPSAAEAASDDDFANVVLLLDGDGTSGDANNTFTDSSTNGFTVTETGSVIQGSFNPYSDRWSVKYDGSSSTYFPGGTQYEANTTGFTVSFFARGTATGTEVFVAKGTTGSTANSSWWLETVSGVMKFYISNGSSYVIVSDTVSFSSYNGWVHVAAVIDNGTAKLYMNGALKGSQSVTAVNATGTVPVSIGAYYNGNTFGFNGYISNVRIHQSALYSGSSFDVPTTVKRENAKLWAHYGKNFKHYFTSHGAPSFSGTIKHVPYSPVTQEAITQELSITDGGSAYFGNGAGTPTDYLSISDATAFDIGSNQFTFECWVYLESINNSFAMFFAGEGVNYYLGYYEASGGGLTVYGAGSDVYSGDDGRFNLYEWNHIVFQRGSGNLAMYLNGTQVYSSSYTDSFGNTSPNGLSIGKSSSYSDYGVNGYIADVRFSNGFTLYGSGTNPSSIAVPTAPLTAISNTDLLLNFQDAGIYDRSGINNLDTVGNAQIDTAVTKYGTGSIEFDGNSDYLLGAENQGNTLAISGAFTAECWFYQTASAGTGTALHALISQWNNATNNKAFVMGISSTSMVLYVSVDGSSNAISGATGGTVSNNTWNHAALTWDGTNYRVFLNGTAVITQANSSAPYSSNEVIQIGASKAGSGGALVMFYEGYMDDIRITNGVARYTSNFTPPTAELPKF